MMKKSKTFISFAIGASLFAGAVGEARAESFFQSLFKLFAPQSQRAQSNHSDSTTPSQDDSVIGGRDANLFS